MKNFEVNFEEMLELSSIEWRVWADLMHRANNNTNQCYPTVQTICDDIRCNSPTKIKNAIKSLSEKGYIKVEKHKNKGGWDNNIYTVLKYYNVLGNNFLKKEEKVTLISRIENESEEQDKKEKEIKIMKNAKFTKVSELYRRYNDKAMKFEQAFMDGGFSDENLAKKSNEYRTKANFYKSTVFTAKKKNNLKKIKKRP